MPHLIDDSDLLVVETEAHSGNVTSIFYFIGGLVERGRIEEAQRHVDVLMAKGYLEANAALGEFLYLRPECQSAIADLSEDQRFQRYLDMAAPYATSERPGAVVAAFDIGDELDDRERHAEALPWFLRAAERGHEEAAIYLGYAFTEGLGTAVNVLEGARWFMRSLEMAPVDSVASDATKWPVNREIGWIDWMMFGEMARSLSHEDRVELMRLVSKPGWPEGVDEKNLRAVFALPRAQVQSILERDSARASVDIEVTLCKEADVEYTHAVGPTQAVMSLIGAVAAEGEAVLVKVDQA